MNIHRSLDIVAQIKAAVGNGDSATAGTSRHVRNRPGIYARRVTFQESELTKGSLADHLPQLLNRELNSIDAVLRFLRFLLCLLQKATNITKKNGLEPANYSHPQTVFY